MPSSGILRLPLTVPTAEAQGWTGSPSWSPTIVQTLGYVGVAFLVALENVFPPIPSEVILPLAGFVAGEGEASLPGMIARRDDRLGGRARGSCTASRRRSVPTACTRSWSATVAGSGSRSATCCAPRTGSTGDRAPQCLIGRCVPLILLGGVDPGRVPSHAHRPLHRLHRARQPDLEHHADRRRRDPGRPLGRRSVTSSPAPGCVLVVIVAAVL